MRLIDADTLKEEVSNNPLIDFTDDDIFKLIDNAPTVSDRYDEGFRDGYAQCINDKEERKENNRLFQKGGADMRKDEEDG